ncbi:hypothetical protein PSN_2975 [Pseudomonas sp. NGC7]
MKRFSFEHAPVTGKTPVWLNIACTAPMQNWAADAGRRVARLASASA